MAKSALGRGFDSLIPNNFDTSLLLKENERIQKVNVSKIKASEYQPRKDFDEDLIDQLANSIKVHGMIQPIILSPDKDGGYTIIAGERRFRAAKQIKLETVPAIVRTAKDMERIELALVENIQRVDLSPYEQAVSLERLHQEFNLPYEYVAEQLGKALSTVTNLVRLLKLPKEAIEALNNRLITEGHARQIVALKDHPELQLPLLDNIIKNNWTVRQAEQFVINVRKGGIKNEDAIKKRISAETNETKALGKQLSAPVFIRRTAHGGKLEINFKSDEDLERIIKTLLG